jgi:hypothetical protein
MQIGPLSLKLWLKVEHGFKTASVGIMDWTIIGEDWLDG